MTEDTTQANEAELQSAAAEHDMTAFDAARALQSTLGSDAPDMMEDWRGFALCALRSVPEPQAAAQMADLLLLEFYGRRSRVLRTPVPDMKELSAMQHPPSPDPDEAPASSVVDEPQPAAAPQSARAIGPER